MTERPTMDTWELKDGLIHGEHRYTTDREWLDETDDATDVVHTEWVAVRRREIHRSEWGPTCPNCRGDGSDRHGDCPECDGEGTVAATETVTGDEHWPVIPPGLVGQLRDLLDDFEAEP